jgi:hypothetical protein
VRNENQHTVYVTAPRYSARLKRKTFLEIVPCHSNIKPCLCHCIKRRKGLCMLPSQAEQAPASRCRCVSIIALRLARGSAGAWSTENVPYSVRVHVLIAPVVTFTNSNATKGKIHNAFRLFKTVLTSISTFSCQYTR